MQQGRRSWRSWQRISNSCLAAPWPPELRSDPRLLRIYGEQYARLEHIGLEEIVLHVEAPITPTCKTAGAIKFAKASWAKASAFLETESMCAFIWADLDRAAKSVGRPFSWPYACTEGLNSVPGHYFVPPSDRQQKDKGSARCLVFAAGSVCTWGTRSDMQEHALAQPVGADSKHKLVPDGRSAGLWSSCSVCLDIPSTRAS